MSSVRIFKNKWFTKFAKKENISDAKLWETIEDVESGRVDADYGGGVIKQRLSRTNEGKSGGYRSIIENFGSETPSFYDGFTVKY